MKHKVIANEVDLTPQDKEWVDTTYALMGEGEDLVNDAAEEALEYLEEVMQNAEDKNWRKMSMGTHALEMGIGHGLIDHVAPFVNDTLRKKMKKELKFDDDVVNNLSGIYLGRVIKNIKKAVDARPE